MEEVKITSVEKVKDPRRVEAGKKLAALSKQAKEKKASQKMSNEEFQIPSTDSINPLAVVGVVGLVGAIVYYKYFSNTSEEDDDLRPVEIVMSPKKEKEEKPTPKRKELDTLD